MRHHILQYIARNGHKLGIGGTKVLGGILGNLMWHLVPSRRNLAKDAIQFHLQVSPEEASRIGRASFVHNFRSFLEVLLVPTMDKAFFDRNLTIAQPELFQQMIDYDGPVVGVTGHLGGWELLSGCCAELAAHKEPVVVVRTQKVPEMNTFIANLRGSRGITVLDHRSAAFSILKALKRKRFVAFLVDHNCRSKEAIFLPFLQKTAAVNMGPAMLAVRSNAAVWPGVVVRNEEGGYTLHIEKPLLPDDLSGTREERVKQVAEFYTSTIEQYIKAYPEQWFWMHKRWKTRPENE